MKRSENDPGELQITGLEQNEIHNPLFVLQAFTDDFSLASIRQLVNTMRDVCITTENVFFGQAITREDLLHVTRHMTRFFEAAYLYLADFQTQDGKVIVHDFSIQEPSTRPKLMTVLQRAIPSPNLEPYTFPCLILSGKWMEKAGFKAGDKVRIMHEHLKILITLYQKAGGDKEELKRA